MTRREAALLGLMVMAFAVAVVLLFSDRTPDCAAVRDGCVTMQTNTFWQVQEDYAK